MRLTDRGTERGYRNNVYESQGKTEMMIINEDRTPKNGIFDDRKRMRIWNDDK